MKLPSIHTLLNPPPSPPTYDNNTPTVQVLPASPTPSSTIDNVTLSPMLSPALSSTRSPSVSSVDPISPMAMNSSEFPPIHGDDPPRQLIHSSPSLQPRSPTHYLHHAHHHISPSYHHRINSSAYNDSSYGHNNMKDHIGATTLPTPPTTYHPTPTPSIVVSPSTSSSPASQPNQASNTTSSPAAKETVPAPPPCTQILISPTGQPILKRRRGRPPTRSPGYDEGGWTFLSPTVWDVGASSSQQQQQTSQDNDTTMTESMTAFTSSDMDTVLPMPKKKRGRKPKTHIEGNSCFIWKDIGATARRSTTS